RHAPLSDRPSTVDGRARRLALGVVCLCAFTISLDITITNVALPFIAKDLGANTTTLQWVVDAYNITLAGLLLLGGGLADRFGRGSEFLVNLPAVVVGIVFGIRVIPESRRPGTAHLDIVGAVLSVAALGTLLAAIIEGPVRGWGNAATLGLLLVGIAFTAA